MLLFGSGGQREWSRYAEIMFGIQGNGTYFQRSIPGHVEHSTYLPDSPSGSKESGSRVPESICSDSWESSSGGAEACFLGGEPMLVPESAGISVAATDGW